MPGHAPSSPWHTIGGVSRGPVTSDSGSPAAPASILDAPIGFSERDGAWVCDGVSLAAIAREVGTPCYVYSAALIRARYTRLTAALSGCRHSVHYALKANSTLGLVRLIQGLGASADCNSVGEIEVALKAGFAPHQIVFTGVGKSGAEIARAVALGLKAINAESRGELERIDAESIAPGPPHPRGAAGEPRRRRQEPSAHLHRDAPQQVRRADRRRARRSSRRWRSGRASRWSASTSTSARRSPPSSRCRAPRSA